MFKNVVSLRLKPAVTTAHSHTVGDDATRTDDADTLTKIVVITHIIWPQEPHPQHPRHSALTTAPRAWSKLPLYAQRSL